MTRWIHIAAIPPAVLAVAVLAGWVVAMLRRPRPLCRGGASWWDVLHWSGVRAGGCAYDLTGLPLLEGQVRCPECGTLQSPTPRRPRALRRIVCACVLLLSAGACWKVGWIRYGGWAKYTPTTVLLYLDYLPMPRHVETVLEDRLQRGRLWDWQRHRLAALAVYQLRDDHRDWNGDWGSGVLRRLGREAVPRLEAALNDNDWQRRQLAGAILRSRCDREVYEAGPPEPYEPPDRLFEVSLESYRRDHPLWYDAYWSFRFLRHYRERTLSFLPAAIGSDDPQESLIGAGLAGYLKAESLAPLAAPVLVTHLRSNQMYGDARFVAPAILGLGDAGRPYLAPLLNGDDEQARALALTIVKTMDHQRLSVADREAIRNTTCRYTDLRKALEEDPDYWYAFTP
jgi:hypothetical protein